MPHLLLDGFSIASVESVLSLCVRVDIMGAFHSPENFEKLPWEGPSSEEHVPFTQVPFVYAVVTKIQDGGTDIAINSIELVIPCKTHKSNMYFHRKSSNGKTGLPFQPLQPLSGIPMENA